MLSLLLVFDDCLPSMSKAYMSFLYARIFVALPGAIAFSASKNFVVASLQFFGKAPLQIGDMRKMNQVPIRERSLACVVE